MSRAKKSTPGKLRVAQHRSRAIANGSKRVEVTVPRRDASLVKAIASTLRQDGEDANRIRDAVRPLVSSPKAKSGKELVAFFRASPLIDPEFTTERDHSTGRSIDFG